MNPQNKNNTISVVIPTYKSESNLPVLIRRLEDALQECGYEYEVIFVDDSSPDNSLAILRDACKSNPKIKLISLSRNFGQQIATSAGLKYTKGDAVIIMDDDLQDPPEFIPALIKKWEDGYEVVYAVRKSRKVGFLKNIGYRLFYKTLARLSYIQIPQDSGDFGLIDRRIVEIINNMPERDRFVRGLRAWVGFKQIGLECERPQRHKGKPSYNLFKIIKLSTDGIFAFSNVPLQISSAVGFVVSLAAFLGIIFTVVQRIMTYIFPQNLLAVWPGFSTIVLSILFLGGVQLICIGILGEYIARIYSEVKQRPLFLIKEAIGFENKD